MIEVKIINKIEDKVNEYQKRTGATKTWIAKQMNISKQNLYTIMKSQNPTIETILMCSALFECDISELYDYDIIKDDEIEVHRN